MMVPIVARSLLVILALCLSFTTNAQQGAPEEGPIELAGINGEVWGAYSITPTMYPTEEWTFQVVVLPESVRQGTLIDIAKAFFSKFPRTRVRFFSDTEHLQQFVDRDRYFNDRTGTVPEVPFPDSKWVQNHHLANINNRAETGPRRWMLENRYGSKIHSLP